MPAHRTRPSFTSLVAFFLIVTPVVYVLSYAPVVHAHGRIGSVGNDPVFWEGTVAHGSVYPAYPPVDWLIDHTPLQKPLFLWAELWTVRGEFETGATIRARAEQVSRHGAD